MILKINLFFNLYKKQFYSISPYHYHLGSILFTSVLISYSLFPQAPPLQNECLFNLIPPLGAESLNGHKNLLHYLKCSPHVTN